MTLAEKIGQLNQLSAHGPDEEYYENEVRTGRVGSLLNVAFDGVVVDEAGVYQEASSEFFARDPQRTNKLQRVAVEETRLGIPLLFAHDVIHGYRTIFPVPLAEASSWDLAAVEQASRIAAREAASVGIRWTFAPMVDVARDPRWGRIVEGSGEDPLLNSEMAAARVRGFQGAGLADPESVLATAKHYIAYGAAEGGRDYNTVDISERTLRDIYLPPFQAALNAGVGSVMVAFNEIDGVPATGNALTIRQILRGELGFEGVVTSDWGSIYEMVPHGSAADLADATEQAIEAGVDVDMESRGYIRYLEELIRGGVVSEELVGQAVRRVLAAKLRLGLFEQPYLDADRAADVLLCDEHVAAARDMARKAIVLLKNENHALPLRHDLESIAVIGPLADDPRAQLGSWLAAGRAEDSVTPLTSIRERLAGRATLFYARGVPIQGDAPADIAAAIAAAEAADVALVFVGESADMSGEAKSRSSLDLPGRQQELVEAVHATGTPTIVILMNGRPLAIRWVAEQVPAILETWFLGVQAGPAIVDVLWGDFNPSGKLPVTVPRSVGQVPCYYNHKNTGRPRVSKYLDVPQEPLYPFGHGLSYTQFAYRDLAIEPAIIKPSETVRVSATLVNEGDRAGAEVVQLYLRDLVGSVTPPVKELKGFQRIELAPGESRTVSFRLTPHQLAIRNRALEQVVEPGTFQVFVGGSSAEGLSGDLVVEQE